MADGFKYWMEEIFSNRHNSWPVAAILYCLAVFVIRDFFINPIFLRLRELDKKERKDVKKAYLRRALVGWGFFGAALVIFIFLWRQSSLYPVTVQNASLALVSIFFAGLFVVFHLQAMALALLAVLRKAAGKPENSDTL